MTFLFGKSKDNFEASLKLASNEEKKFCSAIHCAYYSCLQLLIHILIEKSSKSAEELNIESKRDKSSHLYYIREVRKLIEKQNKSLILQYNKIEDLKDFRVRSDYQNISISHQQCQQATQLAQSIRDLLFNTFIN